MRASGLPMHEVLEMEPSEYSGWRRHVRRYPPDGTERILSNYILAKIGNPEVTDADLRPWRYTDQEVVMIKRKAREAELDRRNRKITEQLTNLYVDRMED